MQPPSQRQLALTPLPQLRALRPQVGSFTSVGFHIPVIQLGSPCLLKTKHMQILSMGTKGSLFTSPKSNRLTSCLTLGKSLHLSGPLIPLGKLRKIQGWAKVGLQL